MVFTVSSKVCFCSAVRLPIHGGDGGGVSAVTFDARGCGGGVPVVLLSVSGVGEGGVSVCGGISIPHCFSSSLTAFMVCSRVAHEACIVRIVSFRVCFCSVVRLVIHGGSECGVAV